LDRTKALGVSRKTYYEWEERGLMRPIQWTHPGLVYSMEDTYFGRDEEYQKLFLHTMMDLASRYEFNPLAGDFATGKQVAKNLQSIFRRYGSPVFAKRDVGRIQKNHEAEDVLPGLLFG
jgi:hypothetical protein